jgi:hypothetical protein
MALFALARRLWAYFLYKFAGARYFFLWSTRALWFGLCILVKSTMMRGLDLVAWQAVIWTQRVRYDRNGFSRGYRYFADWVG